MADFSRQRLSSRNGFGLLFCALALNGGPAPVLAADFRYIFSIPAPVARLDATGMESGRNRRFACGSPVRPMTDMSNLFTFYQPERTQSVIDREAMGLYVKRTWPTTAMTKRLAGLIEAAIENGDARPEISRCIVRQLREWANAEALLGNLDDNDPKGHRQAILIGIWTGVGAANAYAAAAGIDHIPAEDKVAITSWFARLAEEIVAEFTPPPTPRPREFAWLDGNSNHRYWAAAAVGLLAVHLQNRAKLRWAMDVLHSALAEAQEDGALPRELGRGGRALQYQSFALGGLAVLVRLADANKIALSRAEKDKLAAIARFTAEAFANPAVFAERVGHEQEKKPAMAGWVDILLPHFRRTNPKLAARLEEIAAPFRPFRDEMIALPSTALFLERAKNN